jgi:cardiolipin synthase
LQPLYDANAYVVCFHPLFGRFRSFSEWQWPLYRTHRKLLIIDDDVAYCGGMNISADYAGTLGNNRFRDTHCKITGEAAIELQEVFLRSMKVASKELWVVLEASQRRYREGVEEEKKLKKETEEKGVSIQVLQSDVLNNKRQIQKALTYAISRSQRYCHITSPYFLPPKKLRNSLIHSAKRGVDITIITQGVCTTPIISEATQYISSYFIRHGIKIYRLDNQELHAKTLVIDDYYSTVGTFNFDHLSFKYLLEVNVAITDENVAKEMEDRFQEDLKNCSLVTLEKLDERSWWTKFFHWLCYQFTIIVCR